MDENHPTHNLFYSVVDTQSSFQQECPAMTTMLYRVCGGDHDKFIEAMRLVSLFMVAAYEKGKSDELG